MNEHLRVKQWVTTEGELDERHVKGRETLYQGWNGRCVERFIGADGCSYIFKPLTHPDQYGKEQWVAEHVLPALPPIYPRLIAASSPGTAPERSWIVYEDLGRLVHDSSEETMIAAAAQIARWHSLPAAQWAGLPRHGHKPPMDRMLDELLELGQTVNEMLANLGIHLTVDQWKRIPVWIRLSSAALSPVLCHGDLHPGNIAASEGRTVIIDWEHAHLNNPLWDVYHLIDLSHPLFPRRVSPELRERVLEAYLDGRERHGERAERVKRSSFVQWYHAYAFVFSIWMLRLIEGDLRREHCVWPEDQLRNQWRETAAALNQCAAALFGQTTGPHERPERGIE
ncbi:aminoglycoside phosphotransferase family protein [Paenibacillus sp. JJ-223]|uniref:phosphotransferase family protein n=1 Tax=Paenibacillus sp. JJ-223 TaxID=2905647 RepID=UPI001F32D02D|nr:aminoglycoside phosphotransferase family protein [Paenibacillus sp. JJ-223]CAH1196630.1 hypothetical protein PAECIP111890_00981 [Paenibacillus sp. JJ-223]